MPRFGLEVLSPDLLERGFYLRCPEKACDPERVETYRAWGTFPSTASVGSHRAFQGGRREGRCGDVGDVDGCDLQHDPLASARVLAACGFGHVQAVAGGCGAVSVRADRGAAEVAVDASASFLGRSRLYERQTMIRENDWKQLELANRELVMCLERLRKVRASGNRDEIQRAETAYLQALQWVYDAAVGAVSDGTWHSVSG